MNWKRGFLVFLVMMMLSACATIPTGPSARVMVLPGPGKSFEAFQSDDSACRQWAREQIGAPSNETANKTLASGAAIGTMMGAGLGAAIGAASGRPGAGAAIGAAAGLVGGTAAASGPAYAAGFEVQRRYDNAYQQCMYAKGNQIPGLVHPSRRVVPPPPPPPPDFTPGAPVPPPPGAYPPPPPP
ncbi:MAG: glycine zipper family protein [Thermodesulfobacteriota bacterium]